MSIPSEDSPLVRIGLCCLRYRVLVDSRDVGCDRRGHHGARYLIKIWLVVKYVNRQDHVD